MANIGSYPDDTTLSDDDKFFGVNNAGAAVQYPASLVNKYIGPGLTIAADTWSFSSYNSTTKLGVINATSGANTRYTVGQWIKFTQPTLGVKWAKITSLASSTITARFISSQLDNEAISAIYYSAAYAPLGSPNTGVISSSELGLSVTTDANGWTIIDYGTSKVATKRVTFSQSVATTGSTLTLNSTNLPVGLTNVSLAKSMVYSTNVTGFAYALTCMFEGSTTATALNFTARSSDSARGYDGTISVTFII